MPKRIKLAVSFTLPEGATTAAAKDYVHDAVTTWAGSLFPGDEGYEGDPMFDLDRASVKVTLFKKKKRRA